MKKELSLKERFAFRFIFNEKRVYHRWYSRFFVFGIDYGRLHRVVKRIGNWFQWCLEWSAEGRRLHAAGEAALEKNNPILARTLFHESVACFHIGQHIFFIDAGQKEESQQLARESYKRAISLYPEHLRPVRIEIPFEDTVVPGYLHRTVKPNRPLVIYVNGMDNIKEAENHYFGSFLAREGINYFAFDGPGQGEMWKTMKFRLDYEKVVSAIIDWFMKNNNYSLNLDRIAAMGFSLGGYLAPYVAAHDRRICCAVGNSGFAKIGGLSGAKKLNPVWQRGIMYMTGCDNFTEAVKLFDLDITKAPALKVPLLFFHAGKDEVMPEPKRQADIFAEWAAAEKEINFIPDAEHCTVNVIDETFPYMIDWLIKRLA